MQASSAVNRTMHVTSLASTANGSLCQLGAAAPPKRPGQTCRHVRQGELLPHMHFNLVWGWVESSSNSTKAYSTRVPVAAQVKHVCEGCNWSGAHDDGAHSDSSIICGLGRCAWPSKPASCKGVCSNVSTFSAHAGARCGRRWWRRSGKRRWCMWTRGPSLRLGRSACGSPLACFCRAPLWQRCLVRPGCVLGSRDLTIALAALRGALQLSVRAECKAAPWLRYLVHALAVSLHK